MAIRVRERVDFSLYERSYLPEVIRGVLVTTRHLLGNLFGRRDKRHLQTIRYPEQQRIYPPRYRGQHRLLPRDDGSPRCVACYMCATVCPAHCITIIAEAAPDEQIEKRPAAFEIDQLRCIYCGFCVDVCPEDAIRMDTGLHTPACYSRDEAVTGRFDLLAFVGRPGTAPAFGAQNYREGKPRGS